MSEYQAVGMFFLGLLIGFNLATGLRAWLDAKDKFK